MEEEVRDWLRTIAHCIRMEADEVLRLVDKVAMEGEDVPGRIVLIARRIERNAREAERVSRFNEKAGRKKPS